MYVFRVILVVFLSFLAIAESLDRLGTPDFHESLFFDDKSNPIDLEYFMSNWSNDSFGLLNFNDDDESLVTSVDCKDMNSRISQGLKIIFANNVDLNKTINVQFYFSSRKQPRRVRVHTGEKFSLEGTDFNIERRTVLIVHGFLSGGTQSWIKKMTEAFLLWDDVNVVVVDWSVASKTINYFKAAITTRIIGNEIAKFLRRLADATIEATSPREPNWGKLHLIGHSLGSHVSGIAAHDLKKMQNHWQVSRITGLDPALPCFVEVSTEHRLDPDDAAFVDIIHTSATEKLTVGFGNLEPLGDVDFYANGGRKQPGCSRLQGSIFDIIWIPTTPIVQGTCSHGRACLYFTESLIQAAKGDCTFWGHKWDKSLADGKKILAKTCNPNDCTEMGIRAENHPHRGSFFVTTTNKSPFCVGSKRKINQIENEQDEYISALLDE